MIPLLFILSANTPWLTQTHEASVRGNVKYYDPGLMAHVAVNRGYIDDISQYNDWLVAEGIDGGASLLRYGDLGRRFSIIWPNGAITHHIAIDCADRKHYEGRVRKKDVAEVDYTISRLKGMRGPVMARVELHPTSPHTKFTMN